MKLPKVFIVFLALLLSFVDPSFAAKTGAQLVSEKEHRDIFEVIHANKSLQTSNRFILVDDFNSGKLSERKGATWQVKSPVPGALDLEVDKTDGRSAQRGYSLKASFNLLEKEEVSFQSFLNLLDVSQAEYLVFRLRVKTKDEKPFSGRLRLELTDSRHKKVRHDLTNQISDNPKVWSDVVLPARIFKSLDKDALFLMKFIVVARDEALKGDLWVDEIAFFSFKEHVGFESNRDNLVGFPEKKLLNERRENLRYEHDDDIFLTTIAEDTWKYFQNARDKDTDLVVDHIRVGKNPLAAAYTSPTNIAMDLMGTVAAMDLRFILPDDAEKKVSRILTTLEKMKKYKGFFYNFYDTKKLSITRTYISSVDSGWLAIGLVVIRQAFPGKIAERATKLLDGFNFDEFIDPENRQFVIGFDVPVRNFGHYHYGMLVSEARATSLYAIGKGDVTEDHWWFLYRTPPKAWDWQNQKPKGKMKTEDGIDYFQGYYKYKRKKFVPSWGGSLFEYLMPTLVLKERDLAPDSLGLNNRVATQLQRDYALKKKKYDVWGISPAAMTSGRSWKYGEYGVKELSVKGYPDRGIITPHVSFLALDSLHLDAILNVRKLLAYKIYGEYGYYDSVSMKDGKVNPQYLALDQGMILVAIANYLTGGSIQARFHEDPVGKKAGKILMKESFFK